MDFSNLYSDDDSSDSGSSSLTQGILDSVTRIGQTAIIATQHPTVYQQYPYAPPGTSAINPVTGQPYATGTSSATSGLLLFGVLLVGAIIILRK